MKDMIQGMLLFVAMTLVAVRSEADPIDQALNAHFPASSELQYLNYESVSQSHANDYGDIKYLVMDFQPLLAKYDPQPAIHQICQKVLTDVALLTELSVKGYDMVSVSFDRINQYDCL